MGIKVLVFFLIHSVSAGDVWVGLFLLRFIVGHRFALNVTVTYRMQRCCLQRSEVVRAQLCDAHDRAFRPHSSYVVVDLGKTCKAISSAGHIAEMFCASSIGNSKVV